MNILSIFPGMSKQLNDNAYALIRLSEKGVKMTIIACRDMGQKGEGALPEYEKMNGIDIYRLYKNAKDMFLHPDKQLNAILEITKKLKPDLIFCDQELNMRLALQIQSYLKKPLVLMVEDAGRISSGEFYNSRKIRLAMFLFGMRSGPKFWSWLCEKSDALITCSPKDQQILSKLSEHGKPVYYLPWPSYVPSNFEFASSREKGRGIYIGSLYPFKNTQEFEKTLPMIIEKTKTTEFIVVGPGPHAQLITELGRRYTGKITYHKQLPRIETLKLISSSYYAYSPVKIGGWGFIGDCWSMKTPIVMTHNDNYVIDKVNALVSETVDDLVSNINRLYSDNELYQNLQKNGFEEYGKRKADVVGDKLHSILSSALE